MPTSTYSQIPALIRYLQDVQPVSILDVGLGNGKLGFIARDFLDVMLGERYRREDWKIRIDGIEAFGDYIQDHQRAIYDEIYIGDACEVIDSLQTYEVIMLGDVLEHLDRARAEPFLDTCLAHCTKAVILSIPLGERWTQEDIYGNPYERHRSYWQPEEFLSRASHSTLLEFPHGAYGTFLIRREDDLHFRSRRTADLLWEQGRMVEAIATLDSAIRDHAPNLNTYVQLSELHVRRGDFAAALRSLEDARLACPGEASLEASIAGLQGLLASTSDSAYVSSA